MVFDVTGVRVFRRRRDATPGVISIWFLVFIFLFGSFEFSFLQILLDGFPVILIPFV